jgi:VanZ family protein
MATMEMERLPASRTRLRLWWLALAVWTAALVTPYPVYVSDAVLPEEAQFPAAKTLHVTAYAALTAAIPFLGLRRGRWWLLVLLSLHGAATEAIQLVVPERTGSMRDVGLDHVGIALGFVFTLGHWLRPPGNGG